MDAPLTVARSAAPLREEVVRILRKAIVDGRFPPGSRLTERDLIALLDASRTTIREAVRQLEAEGFVRSIPGKGLEVASVTPDDVRDLYEMRAVLEGLAARLFAERASEVEKRMLRGAFEELLEGYERGDIPSIIERKDRFYDVLFRGAGNPLLQSYMETLHARIKLLRSASLSSPGRLQASADELRPIVDAIERGDAEAAERYSIAHVQAAASETLRALARESLAQGDGAYPNDSAVAMP